MGIKRFFVWLSDNYSENLHKVAHGEKFEDIGVAVDNLMIDMNGIFHSSAQRVYKYGNCKPPPRLLKGGRPKHPVNFLKKQKELFEDVCATIDSLVDIAQPMKRIILCVDGPAPLSKQYQQRQRRFRSAAESSGDCPFDSNCITPGTKFMDHLSKYVDWHVRKRVSDDPVWRDLEVIFSDDKAPGEGEHKLINYMRFYGDKSETYCIHGLDADLVMLSLATHIPNFYILREDLYDRTNEFFCVDIGGLRESLVESMRWESERFEYDESSAINDFVFLCYTVGNDFLPHIPSIEIADNGLELLIGIYKEVGSSYGHLTRTEGERVTFCLKQLEVLMGTIGHHEKDMIEAKIRSKKPSFSDPLVDSFKSKDGLQIDIDGYRKAYHELHFSTKGVDEKTIAHAYLEGLQWVLSYYTRGIPSWDWCFPFHYAPMASALETHISSYVQPVYVKTSPYKPFLQLLSVLPPKSSDLIPEPLSDLLNSPKSTLRQFCPDKIEIDLAGKMREWEGIVLLPLIDRTILLPLYEREIGKVNPRDASRNVHSRSVRYLHSPSRSYKFPSQYGDLVCKVNTQCIDV
jgi:5'-3' exoribonuclease 1